MCLFRQETRTGAIGFRLLPTGFFDPSSLQFTVIPLFSLSPFPEQFQTLQVGGCCVRAEQHWAAPPPAQATSGGTEHPCSAVGAPSGQAGASPRGT